MLVRNTVNISKIGLIVITSFKITERKNRAMVGKFGVGIVSRGSDKVVLYLECIVTVVLRDVIRESG